MLKFMQQVGAPSVARTATGEGASLKAGPQALPPALRARVASPRHGEVSTGQGKALATGWIGRQEAKLVGTLPQQSWEQ